MKNHLLTYLTFGSIQLLSPNGNSTHKNPINTNSPRLKFLVFVFLLIIFAIGQKAYAQTATYSGATGGNWNTAANWTITAPAAVARVPLATDNVVIPNNRNVTVNTAAVCASFVINNGIGSNTITISGTNSLTVTNGITINAPTAAGTKQIAVGATASLSCGSITMANTLLTTADCLVTSAGGTITVSGNITMGGTSDKNMISFTAGGTMNLGGNMSGGGFTCGTSTVNCTGAAAQTISGGSNALSVPTGYTFYDLNITKTAAANTVAFTTTAITVTDDMNVTTGTASFTATDANFAITDDLVIGANGTLINTVDYAATTRSLTIGGDWTTNAGGSFTPGLGNVVFNNTTGAQAINGTATTQSFYNLTVAKTAQTLSVAGSTTTLNIAANTTLSSGVFAAGTAANINMTSGNWINNGATFTPGTGTVNFTGTTGAQNIQGTAATQSFNNISMNKLAQQLNVAGSTTTLNLSGTMLLTAGTFAAGTATAINMTGGDWTNNGATFTPGSGTVTFNSTTVNQNINGSAVTQGFNNITMNKTGRQLTVGGSTNTLNLTGNILLTAGTLVAGTAADINIAGNWTNNGATFTPGTGTVAFNSTTATQNINGTAATQSFNNIVVNKAGQQLNVAGSTTTLNASGSVTLNAGTFVAGTATTINMTGGDWINNGATFTPGSGTIVFNSTSVAQNITGTAATQTFNNITVNKSGQQLNVAGSTATLNLNGNMLLTAGTFAAGTAANINIAGNWTNNGATFTPGTGTVTFNSTTATQNINGTAATQTFNNVTVNKSGQQLNVAGSTATLNVGGTMTLTAGTFAAGTAANINMTGDDWINNGATFTPGTGTVNFTSTTAGQSIRGTAATQTFNNITINKAGQVMDITGSTTTLTLNGNMTLTAGILDAGTAANINIAGNWSNSGTSFIPGTGRVTFNGTPAQNISGTTITDFYNVTLNNTNGLTLSTVDVNINGGAAALTFTNGKITTGTHKVAMLSSGTISGAGTGKYVYGNLQLGVATGSPARVFEIGDASVYAPISVIFNSVTVAGNVTAYTTGGEHPSILTSTIDETADVNRYWTMSNSGVVETSYTATFNWVAADMDAGATFSNFIIGRRTSSWAYPSLGAKNATNITGTMSSFGSYACGEGGAAVPAMATQPVDQSACSGGSMSYVAAANSKPTSTVVWEISTDGGSTFSTLTIASPYSVVTNSASGVTTSTLTINPTVPAMDQYSYRAIFTNSRGNVTSFDGLMTLTAAPTANAGSALAPICGGSGSSAPLGGSVGGSATGGTWSTPSGGTFSPSATDLNAIWTPPGAFSGTATLTLTTSGGPCGTATAQKTQVVSASPSSFTLTPSSANTCINGIQSISATTTTTQSSGTVSLGIPNNSATGVTSALAIAGIPAGATIYNVSVTFNVAHGEVSDLYMNLRAPNGNILNLANRPTNGNGNNFTNTVVSMLGTSALSSGSAPFTGTFSADGASGVGATGYLSNVTSFSSLTGTASGNWTLIARDAAASNTGTLTSWSISIEWSANPITWSPITNLYTNAAATTAYTAGTQTGTVYCKLPAVGTTTYTATATNGASCTTTATAAITAGPVITITPDYCYGGGYIQLQASSTPAATSWLWSTGATSSSILVNLAGNYTVTATTGAGCVASTAASIAQELVVNGAFTSGNSGFTSAYTYVTPGGNNMYPEATYTVNTDPHTDHGYFFGNDHTTGSGNMLIVNGSNLLSTVWQETFTVQPNTTYYFSAWAVSVNDVPPYAQLQFDINGSGIGTTAVLPAGPNNTSTPSVWQQFYGSWTSGAGVTSATVTIKDLQIALGGNDFAIDDISFGTLSTFVSLTSGAGSDTVRTCKNVPMTSITYSVGAGATGPSVTGLPPGVSYSFNGVTLTISGTPTALGVYDFTVTNSSCNPITKYGQITVIEDTLTLTSAAGTNAQSGCLGTAITNITYSVGTSATGATVTGLPPGVTSSFSSGVLTITGTPTTASTYTYTVTTTGSCSPVSATGTIYVRRQIISRTSAAGTNVQSICINTAITNITYAIGGVATGAGVTGLPTGVTGTYNSGTSVFTISGTPTAPPGVYSYQVTTTGPCNSVNANGTITVNGPTANLSSAVGTDAQTVCVNTAITNITYTIAGTATGAGISGLPAGVTGSYNTGVFTISGTPTATGTSSYTITTSGGSCGTTTANGTITVSANNTVGVASSTPTLCINTALTAITHTTTGATGISNSGVSGANGLPAGVSATWGSNLITISGTPTASGTFNYSIALTGGCGSANATGTITVTAANTVGVASSTPTLCINTALTAITHTTTGATGISNSGVSGANSLPAGVSATWASNTITISGTPTASGTFNYSIALTGGCGTVSATGTITVTAANTAGAASSTPTLCISTALTAITHTTTGATGISNSAVSGANGLPAGVSATWASNTITISGTPTASGTFNYSIPLTGGCGTVSATGTITVTANKTAGAASSTPTLCINTALTAITHTTTGATGISNSGVSGANGLPTGVSATWASNTITISGTPTASGTFNYSIALTGGCGSVNATGTITVTAANTAGAASSTPTLCISTALTAITHTTTGATGISNSGVSGANGLPAGVSATWASNTITISGTPTASGTFNYSIALTGGCGTVNATGTITVTANKTAGAASSTPTLCVNTALTAITHTTTGATGISNSGVSGANGLPAGVSATWASNTITISGTPAASGTFNYSIALTGGCGTVSATGTITVTAANTAGAASSTPTLCISTALTAITHTTTGATGISNSGVSGVNGLPAGVSATWASNTITISGTPTASGTFNYSIALTGGCGTVNATGTITVTANKTAGAASSTPTLCINTALTAITHTTAGATGISNSGVSGANGLPAGVSATWASNTITISGTPTASGTFNYSIALTGGCGTVNATGTITVTANNTASAASSTPTLCINTALTAITHTTTGATGISNSAVSGANGLPAGVSATWASNTITISGTPTASGTFNYSIALTGGCGTVSATGTITVTANKTAAAASSTPTLCINTALTAITHTTTGATGIANSGVSGANGLPAGVSATWASNTITISGTPTASGTFNYSIALTGGCGSVNATGTITVTAANTAGAASSTPTLCISTALTAITHTTTGATGISNSGVSGANGLPAGVSATWASNTITISGTPTASGTFNYSIALTGGCGTVNATGTITVTANKTAGAASSTPTLCVNTALTAITHTTTGATGISNSGVSGANGLPAGVSATWASNTITISGTPAASGTFNYSIALTGGCGTVSATGTIIVHVLNTATLSSVAGTDAQTVCINTAITNITYVIGGSATGAGVSGLPAGVSGSFSAGVYTITGTPTVAGTYTYTVTTTGGACTGATATGTLSVSPVPVGGTIADIAVCYADNGNLSLIGNVGSVTRWETSTDGSTWTNISNTTTTQSFTAVTQTTWYRARVQSGACAATVYSNTAKVGIHNLWTGQTSADWNTGSNWSDGMTPTTSCPDVTIPVLSGPNVYPQLTSGTATINNLVIHPSATMIVSNAILQVAGTITNNGTLDITGGTLELNGSSSAQTIAGSTFSTHTIMAMVISNSNGVSFANTNDTMSITGVLSFGANNAVLNTNNNLTLVSNAAGTASVGDLTNGGTISGANIIGNATVERYIPTHPKAWQFLSTPTSGQSINNAWQEGNTTLGNTRPGYGTIITGEMSGAVANGFDIYTPTGPSMKTYNAVTNTWAGVASTSMQISNKKGYMFFVRGDRSVTTSSAPATATTLRTTGKLFTIGADAPASTTILAGKMESIGNPYASAIDFTTVNKPAAPDVDDAFYIWDPLLTNNYFGLGGYQTISAANGWKPIPGGTTNYDANTAYPYIQSGQAFMVHATGAGGTMSFSEANKVNQYSMANRTVSTNAIADRQFLRLYLYNASSMLSDGNVVAFDSDFSNDYDANDAIKANNSGENLGILRGGRLLALEARSPVVSEDTVFYSFGNVRRTNYQLRFNPENMAPGLTAKLVDKYTNTTTAISMTDTSSYNFVINYDAGSWALDRLYLVFKQAPAVAITAITAERNTTNGQVAINYTVQNEAGVQMYELERSGDGAIYNTIAAMNPSANDGGTHAYLVYDANPLRGTNYYRVKGSKTNNSFVYSAVVKVVPGKNQPITGKNTITEKAVANETTTTEVNIFPNPVVNRIINLQFINHAEGTYQLELISQLGETVYRKTIRLNSNTATEKLYLEGLIAAGNYQLKIKSPDGLSIIKQVVIQ